MNVCKRCGKSYLTGADNVASELMERASVSIWTEVGIHLEGKSASEDISKEHKETGLCPACGSFLYKQLAELALDFVYGKVRVKMSDVKISYRDLPGGKFLVCKTWVHEEKDWDQLPCKECVVTYFKQKEEAS